MSLKLPERPSRKWLALGLGLGLALGPAALMAQDETDFDPISIFQDLAPAPGPNRASGIPPLPPSATDPFVLPPAGSVPLGSSAPPLTSPVAPAAGPTDDPFGTPAPVDRQVRQLPETPTAQSTAGQPMTGQPASAQDLLNPAGPGARQTLDDAQRARLRALFPDMLPQTEPLPSTAPATPAASVPTAPVPAASPPAALVPSPPAPAVPAKTTPTTPVPAAIVTTTLAPMVQPGPAAAPEQLENSAISKAGALLTQEYYGQAKILPPLELPPARKEDPPETGLKPAAKPKAAPDKGGAATATAAPSPAPTPAPAKKTQAASAPAPPPARGALTLVNETGDPKVGAIYQSALSRLGYTVLSGPAGGPPPAPAGQTVIYYRPEARARARAVSRDLPGRKTLAEAPGAATDIVVVVR